MPEEVNRLLVDHLSTLLFCPTTTAVANLAAEGVTDGVELVGDVMLDAARFFAERVPATETLARFGVEEQGYYLATVHRAANSDDPARLASIIRAFSRLTRPVLWAVHPRTAKNMQAFGLRPLAEAAENLSMVPPVSYMETGALLRSAFALLTDSGGMQKEAYFFGVPCLTLRERTEWVETVELGWNTLVGTDEDRIVSAAATPERPAARPEVYGDGHAADVIAAVIDARLGGVR
jgi:UDP-N-acetylglucosamine 2-epimerase